MDKPRLLTKYLTEIVPTLKKEWHVTNSLAIPKLVKIIVNTGITDEQHRDEALENMRQQIQLFTGQNPVITRAKLSIAGFKLRAGDSVGLKVTLRRQRMYEFLDKLISVVLPRVKDFQGVKRTAFDGHGNFNLGIIEQIVFPEVEYDKIDRVRSLEITLVTNAQDDTKALRLLELFGLPFTKAVKKL